MKFIRKTASILKDNSGETMVEVLVAFTLLSIMLVVFSEGIAWASKSEMNATKSRNDADAAMIALQRDLAAGNEGNAHTPIDVGSGQIVSHTYIYGNYQYTVYTAG